MDGNGGFFKKGDCMIFEEMIKTECTDEALCAVLNYLYAEAIRENHTVHGYEWTMKDGKVVELLVKIRES